MATDAKNLRMRNRQLPFMIYIKGAKYKITKINTHKCFIYINLFYCSKEFQAYGHLSVHPCIWEKTLYPCEEKNQSKKELQFFANNHRFIKAISIFTKEEFIQISQNRKRIVLTWQSLIFLRVIAIFVHCCFFCQI